MTMGALKGRWRLVLVSAFVGLLSGCPTSIRSPHDFASGYVGSPIAHIFEIVDRKYAQDPKNEPSREEFMKTRYVVSNGNTVYVRPANFKRCNIHWEVNPAGVIVGYRYEEVVKGGCSW